jgi:hypothetical protein
MLRPNGNASEIPIISLFSRKGFIIRIPFGKALLNEKILVEMNDIISKGHFDILGFFSGVGKKFKSLCRRIS